jgi:hypothetical protein
VAAKKIDIFGHIAVIHERKPKKSTHTINREEEKLAAAAIILSHPAYQPHQFGSSTAVVAK